MINIVLIHKGIVGRKKDNYLSISLRCAHKYNPRANIFLISDKIENNFSFVKYFNINDYFDSAKKFVNLYQHFSTNSYDFELFCIQRWFILRDFMKINKIDNCFYIDSDVLIFSDLFTEQQKFSNFSFTLSEGTCGHNSFWNSYKAIDDFCNFIENVYSKKDFEYYKKMINFWEKYKISGNLGGVCDMTLFKFYKQKYPNLIGETTKIIDNSTYDHNISCVFQGDINFKNIFGVKNICWRNNLPYVKNSFGELIKFNTLHCQGWAKKIMNKIFLKKKIISLRFLCGRVFNYLLKKTNLLMLHNNFKNKK